MTSLKIYLEKYPSIELNSGLRIVNFSSPHSYKFHTGETLMQCNDDVASNTKLEENHKYIQNKKGWEDVSIHYDLSAQIYNDLTSLADKDEIDIILVPYPVMKCAHKEYKRLFDIEDERLDDIVNVLNKIRVCKLHDRVTKEIRSDIFCVPDNLKLLGLGE